MSGIGVPIPSRTTGLPWIVAITLGLVGSGFVLHFPGTYGQQA